MGDALAPWHIIIILVVFVVLFGARKLPVAAKSLGEAMNIFKKEVSGLRHEDSAVTPTAAAPASAVPVVTAPPALSPTAQPSQQEQIEQMQRQLSELQRKTAGADGATVNGVPLSEAQRNQPG